MSLIRQFAIRNELLYSGFVLPNVQIFFLQKISFATFGVSIDEFLTRYAGLGYSLIISITKPKDNNLVDESKLLTLSRTGFSSILISEANTEHLSRNGEEHN